MAVKNAVAKNWTLSASFDGLLYSAYPAGDKPSGYQTTPTLIDTDIRSGSLAGFENNKGCYLRLYGYNLGRQNTLGTASGARVYLRDPLGDNAWHEVDNYRALNSSRVYSTHQVIRIIVQVGTLGGSITVGRALDVKITVNGVDTNILTGWFTVQNGGDCYFVDPVSGNDATGVKNDITKPFRYVQKSVGGTNSYTGIWGAGNLKAGDTICLRAGTYTDQLGFDNRFVRFRSHTGSAPTSTANTGPISFTAYPGPALGHAPEVAHFVDPASGNGGIQGVNTAYQGVYGQYVNISGLWLECSATSVSDSAPINVQAGGNNWRIVDNELGPWPSTTTGASDARAGGVAGQGIGMKILFNYIHDIGGDPAQLQNHGIYIGDANGICSQDWEIAYNWIYNSYGGSSIQCNNTAGVDNFVNIDVHHNFIDGAAKYGVNMNNSVASHTCWNNIILNPLKNCWRTGTPNASATISVISNTMRQASSNSAYASLMANESANITTGTWKFQHNIFVAAGATITAYNNFAAGDTAVTVARNLYFDETGTLNTVPSKDATGIYGDPLFTSVAAKNFTVGAGSPALDVANAASPALTVNTDLYGMVRPINVTRDIGACEGVGT